MKFQFQNVLVGLDLQHGDRIASQELEPASTAALKQATELARCNGARLTLCTVVEISEQAFHLIEVDQQNIHRTVEDIAATNLEKIAAGIREQGIPVETRVVIGRGWEQICKLALRGQHDLVLVGTRKQSPMARMLFGNTCSKLMRYCPVTLWITKPCEVRELREILVASDFSEMGQQVTFAGVAVAQSLNAKLFVAHALEFPFEVYLRTAGISEMEVARYRKRLHDEARGNLQAQLAQTDSRTIAAGVQIEVVEGSPDTVIPQLIDSREIDLLVIGSHGRTGFTGILLGNTAERILPYAHSSLLLVRPANFVSPVTADA